MLHLGSLIKLLALTSTPVSAPIVAYLLFSFIYNCPENKRKAVVDRPKEPNDNIAKIGNFFLTIFNNYIYIHMVACSVF